MPSASSRAATAPSRALMTARGLVDLLIPRGGADLIQTVVTESTVPVIETGVGNCHVYVDRAADLDKALAITVNSKTHRPSVCNAAESLLVHRDVAAAFLPKALAALSGEGVTLHTDADAGAQADTAGVAHDAVTDEDFATEFHGLEMAVGVVDDLDAALEHIRRYGIGPHRGDRHRGPRGRPSVHRRGRRGRGHGQREHPLHRRWRVRLRRRDRHLDPEAARPGPDGPARAHDDQVGRRGRRSDPGLTVARVVGDRVRRTAGPTSSESCATKYAGRACSAT